MASYMYEMCCDEMPQVRNNQSDWDLSEYEEIEDFKYTTNYRDSRYARAW